ncbi:MAG: hypothetical protein ABIL40_11775, partial [candidate division WOR-3 bacterium]
YAKEIMPELNPNIALFPPVLLDNLTTSSYWRTVNKVPRHYINAEFQDMVSTLKEYSGLKR